MQISVLDEVQKVKITN